MQDFFIENPIKVKAGTANIAIKFCYYLLKKMKI